MPLSVKFKSKIFLPTPPYVAQLGVDSVLCRIAGRRFWSSNRIELFRKFESLCKTVLAHESGDPGVQFDEKTRGQKSRETVPLSMNLMNQCIFFLFIFCPFFGGISLPLIEQLPPGSKICRNLQRRLYLNNFSSSSFYFIGSYISKSLALVGGFEQLIILLSISYSFILNTSIT
jgi:hypothetical protein